MFWPYHIPSCSKRVTSIGRPMHLEFTQRVRQPTCCRHTLSLCSHSSVSQQSLLNRAAGEDCLHCSQGRKQVRKQNSKRLVGKKRIFLAHVQNLFERMHLFYQHVWWKWLPPASNPRR